MKKRPAVRIKGIDTDSSIFNRERRLYRVFLTGFHRKRLVEIKLILENEQER